MSHAPRHAWPGSGYERGVLGGLAQVLTASPSVMPSRLSRLLRPCLSHSALMVVMEDDANGPLKQPGDDADLSRVSLTEIETARQSLARGTTSRVRLQLAGRPRPVFLALAGSGALLVLTDPGPQASDQLVFDVWEIVALRLQQHASDASPTYLMESRAASSIRTEVVSELTDLHATTLESLLAVLRSSNVDDRGARQAATKMAAEAMVHLRTATDRVRTLTEEPVVSAFERLRNDLRPLVRYRDIDVQFVEPPVDGRALPSEVAHGARALVRNVILALIDQPQTTRVRVQWDCDGENLLINLRDDGPGTLTTESPQLLPLRHRVLALNGRMTLTATEGWGAEMSVVLPLDPPPFHEPGSPVWRLAARELEVLDHLVAGLRNRAIAEQLGISENTVKFHVSKIFRKLGVTSRSQVASLVLERRSGPTPAPRPPSLSEL